MALAMTFDCVFDTNGDRFTQACDGVRPGTRKSFQLRPARQSIQGPAMRSPETRRCLAAGSR